jgi:serine/threonine-protein kinase HipA
LLTSKGCIEIDKDADLKLAEVTQPKTSATSGQQPSTHILKPEHTDPEQYSFTTRNEWFVMALAKACGLPVPAVDHIYLPAPAYIVKRFDRVGEYPDITRLHVIDGCQLLGLSFGDKYRASTVGNLKKLADTCIATGRTRLSLFRWAMFNAIVGNGDAHLKNLSFSLDDRGIQLMPHYYLLSTSIYAKPHEHAKEELSQAMGDARCFGQLTRADVVKFGLELGLKEATVLRELDALLKSIVPAADVLIDKVQATPGHGGKAGEMRMLNQIRQLCIAEMVNRLSK